MNKKYCWFLVYSGDDEESGFMSFIDDDIYLNEAMFVFTTKEKANEHLEITNNIRAYIPKRITWKEAYEIATQEGLDILIDSIHRVTTVLVDRKQQLSLFGRN